MDTGPADTGRGNDGPLERHFTVTGFLSQHGRTALHWHRLGMWLPPGGHIEANEDPLQAVLREVREETGMTAQVVPTQPPFPHAHPPQLPPPVTIGVYDIDDPGHRHQHIDLVYFTAPTTEERDPALPTDPGLGWRWVGAADLPPGAILPGPHGEPTPVAEDVRLLALAAIEQSDPAGRPGAAAQRERR